MTEVLAILTALVVVRIERSYTEGGPDDLFLTDEGRARCRPL